MNNIKTILKALRKFNRMTQAELAPKLEISRPYLCEIEKGGKKPTLDLIYKYAEVFKIKPHLKTRRREFAVKLEREEDCIEEGMETRRREFAVKLERQN